MISLNFLLSTALLLAIPGPTNAMIFAAGVAGGYRAGLAASAMAVCGYLVAIGFISSALGPWLVEHPAWMNGVRFVAAFYLCLSAFRLWNADARIGKPAVIAWHAVFLTTLLNPKALIIALVLMPEGALYKLATAVPNLAAFALLVLAISGLWGLFGAGVGRGLARNGSERLTARISAVILGLFGLALVVSGLSR